MQIRVCPNSNCIVEFTRCRNRQLRCSDRWRSRSATVRKLRFGMGVIGLTNSPRCRVPRSLGTEFVQSVLRRRDRKGGTK
jgi:hypothetical protein